MSVWAGRSESTVNVIWRLLWRLALIGILLYAFYRLRNILTTLIVAAIIGYVLDPLVEWLCRAPWFFHFHNSLTAAGTRLMVGYRCHILREPTVPTARVRLRRHAVRLYATLYVFLFALVVFWYGTKLVITPFVAEFRAAMSSEGRQQAMENKEILLRRYNEYAPDWAKSDKIEEQFRKSDFSKQAQQMAAEVAQHLLESLKNVVEIVLLPVLAFYFLIDGRQLKHEFVALLPRARIKEALRLIQEFNGIMRAFVAGQFLLCLLAGVIVGAGLAALGVRYPFILGVLAGVTRAIPIIGPIVGGIPIILLTLATKGFGTALAVLGFFTLLHFVESKFIMPMLIGDRMELHPVVIIIVLIAGGEVGGVVIGGQLGALLGMFFAAPVAAMTRVLIRRYWLRLPPGRPRSPHRPSSAPVSETAPAPLSEAVD
jgi:predicted PurR-regulated permease PerM